MKKFLLPLMISGVTLCASAQTPSFDFETWTSGGLGGLEPAGWMSENATILFGNPQSVFKDSVKIHGGKYAMQIVSVAMPTPITGLPNPIGMVAAGQLVGTTIKKGFKYTGRPASLSFWYALSPVTTDSADCYISFWNSTTHDTIAAGFWRSGSAVGSYTQQTINLNYNAAYATEFPDSMLIIFSSTKLFNPVNPAFPYSRTLCLTCGQANDTLWIDDMSLNGSNGINEYPGSNGVTLYPNPANEFVTVSADVNDAVSAIVYDATGRAVASAPFETISGNKKTGKINTSDLAPGLYSYSLVDKSGNPLRAGKFNVVR